MRATLDHPRSVGRATLLTRRTCGLTANRAAALARGINPVIPRRENSKQRGRFFPKRLYKLRARIEQTIGKLKRFKRVAMRCEKTDISYSAIISFACTLILVNPSTQPSITVVISLLRSGESSESMANHDSEFMVWLCSCRSDAGSSGVGTEGCERSDAAVVRAGANGGECRLVSGWVAQRGAA